MYNMNIDRAVEPFVEPSTEVDLGSSIMISVHFT